MKTVTIALIQSKVSENIRSNVAKTILMIEKAANKGARIIALQELFQTPYFPQWKKKNKDDYAETLKGFTVSEMKKTAKRLGVTIVVPIYEKKGGKYFNTTVVIDKKGKSLGKYHKTHIPHDPGFYEKEYFEHGDTGYKIFEAEGVKFAALICYDQWFPESARMARLNGAQIIFYPTAIGDIADYDEEGDWHDAWETVQRGHAISNSVYVAAVNRVGREGNIIFWGQSFVSDPFGKIIKRASETRQEILVIKLDLEQNELYAEGWGFLRNRRPDTYEKITSRKMAKKSKKLQDVSHFKEMKKLWAKNNSFTMKNRNNPYYKMPSEWEPHSAIWLAWPYDTETFPDRVGKVEAVFAEIISAVQMSEEVELLVLNEEMKARASDFINRAGADALKINFHITDYADVWLRDTGPIFVKDSAGKIVITKWIFNAWGNKFPELLKDGDIPEKISEWENLPIVRPGVVIEGGAIEVNGQGVCLTTEQCLLNKNRHPGQTKADIEKFLEHYLGIRRTVWLKEGLVNDHTDGHIDELARFVSPNKIVCAYEEDENDENYPILQENYKILSEATDINGEPFEVIKLPMPHMRYDDGSKAPVSYTNFYIGNTVVLAATFNDKNDTAALKILEGCFPERRVVGIDCSDIICGGGAVHCITQQEPK